MDFILTFQNFYPDLALLLSVDSAGDEAKKIKKKYFQNFYSDLALHSAGDEAQKQIFSKF
jgi:hypothetical protein